MRLREIMSKNPITISSRDTAYRAAQLMRDAGVDCLVVTDGEEVAGILTDHDLTVRCLASGANPRLENVSQFMTRVPTVFGPDIDARQGAHILMEHGLRYLPVVEDHHPVGIVSSIEIAEALGVPHRDLLTGRGGSQRAA